MVEQEERKIPYIGVARVGDFKLWKARVRERKSDVLHISDMDGTWGVKIPQTYLSFTMIEEAYKDGNDEFLKTCLANMNFVTAITNGFYQQGVAMVGHAYLKPELLREDYKPETGPGHADLLDEAKKVFDLENASDEDKTEAQKSVEEMLKRFTVQDSIESIVKAKGFSDCMCFISDEGVTVIVPIEQLNDTAALIIDDAVTSHYNVDYDKISIVGAPS